MAVNIQVNPVQQQPRPVQQGPSPCLQMLYQLSEVIIQVAIRALFIAAHILMAAWLLPLSWHWVALPIVALGSTVLAAFFFPQFSVIGLGDVRPKTPLLPPVRRGVNGQIPEHYPDGSPVGYRNEGENCAFNSVAHFLDSNPNLAQWLRSPVTDETDWPTFLAFLGTYLPPAALRDQFEQYVAQQPDPKPSVKRMFHQFLENYVPNVVDRVQTDRIKNTFAHLERAHPVFKPFYQANDAAVQNRRAVSDGRSGDLRAVLAQVNPLIEEGNVQTSADFIATPVLDILMPETMKTVIERTVHYNMQGLPPMAEPSPPQVERVGLLPLDIDSNDPAPTLERLIQNSFNYGNVDPRTEMGVDGVKRDYPIERISVEFLEAPPALWFWLKRFRQEPPPEGLYNQFLAYMHREFPKFSSYALQRPIGYRDIKINTPVQCPEEITIRLKNGQQLQYRLSSFVTHQGMADRGYRHYVSGEIRVGHKFYENDSVTTLVENQADQDNWDDQLQHSYLLSYLPVPPGLAPQQ